VDELGTIVEVYQGLLDAPPPNHLIPGCKPEIEAVCPAFLDVEDATEDCLKLLDPDHRFDAPQTIQGTPHGCLLGLDAQFNSCGKSLAQAA
jgi:hypothetical protein